VVPKPVAATPEINLSERVGLTAGSIWHYLAENGATSVAKLVRELPEEEKTIQRSIGWLAQEGKVTLDTIDRVETIALKE
jgi:predicted DNA-binding transcriptional regulator AlpA